MKSKNSTTTERLVRLETKLDLLMNNHMSHVERRLTRLEAGMIGLLCFAVTNLLIVIYTMLV
jgi:hypothetical protein